MHDQGEAPEGGEKNFRPGVGGKEKMVTFAARFGGIGVNERDTEDPSSGAGVDTGGSLTRWHQEEYGRRRSWATQSFSSTQGNLRRTYRETASDRKEQRETK